SPRSGTRPAWPPPPRRRMRAFALASASSTTAAPPAAWSTRSLPVCEGASPAGQDRGPLLALWRDAARQPPDTLLAQRLPVRAPLAPHAHHGDPGHAHRAPSDRTPRARRPAAHGSPRVAL